MTFALFTSAVIAGIGSNPMFSISCAHPVAVWMDGKPGGRKAAYWFSGPR